MRECLRKIVLIVCVICMISVLSPTVLASELDNGNISLVQELLQKDSVVIDVASRKEAVAILEEVQAYVDAVSFTSETRVVTGYFSGNTLRLELGECESEEFTEEDLLVLFAEAGTTIESINSFIVERLSYDYDAIKYGSPKLSLTHSQSTAKGALSDGKAICQGYANLFSLLAEHAGIQNIKVRGYVNNEYHVINVIRVGQGHFLSADITSNDVTGENWSFLTFDDYCEMVQFVPKIDIESAFELKYSVYDSVTESSAPVEPVQSA